MIRATATGFGEAMSFGAGVAATFAAASGDATGGLAARCRLRRGLICLATLSHSVRSSSLKPRLRGGTGNSGIGRDVRRFIGSNDGGGDDGGEMFWRPV